LPFKQAQILWSEMQRKQTIETHQNSNNEKPATIDVNGKRSYANAVKNEIHLNQGTLDSIKKDMHLNHETLDSLKKEIHSKDDIIERLISNSICFCQAMRALINRGPLDPISATSLANIDQIYFDMLDVSNRHKINIAVPTPKMMDAVGKVVPIPPSEIIPGIYPPQIAHPIESIPPLTVPEPTHKSENLQSQQAKHNDPHQGNTVQTANDKNVPKILTNPQKPAKCEANLQATQPKELNQIQNTLTQTKPKEPTHQSQEITPQIQKDSEKTIEERIVQLKVTSTGSDSNGQSKQRQFTLTEQEFNGFIKTQWYSTYYKSPQQGQKSLFLTITDTQYAELRNSPWFLNTYQTN
jgi:hypothetical protein